MKIIDVEPIISDLIKVRKMWDKDVPYENGICAGISSALNRLNNAPIVELKHGKWIEVQISEHFKRMICSKCGDSYVADAITPLEVWINNRHCFCPSCGADMRGLDND